MIQSGFSDDKNENAELPRPGFLRLTVYTFSLMLEVIVKHFPCVTPAPTSQHSKGAVGGEEGVEDSVADGDDGALLSINLFIFVLLRLAQI